MNAQHASNLLDLVPLPQQAYSLFLFIRDLIHSRHPFKAECADDSIKSRAAGGVPIYESAPRLFQYPLYPGDTGWGCAARCCVDRSVRDEAAGSRPPRRPCGRSAVAASAGRARACRLLCLPSMSSFSGGRSWAAGPCRRSSPQATQAAQLLCRSGQCLSTPHTGSPRARPPAPAARGRAESVRLPSPVYDHTGAPRADSSSPTVARCAPAPFSTGKRCFCPAGSPLLCSSMRGTALPSPRHLSPLPGPCLLMPQTGSIPRHGNAVTITVREREGPFRCDPAKAGQRLAAVAKRAQSRAALRFDSGAKRLRAVACCVRLRAPLRAARPNSD